MMNRVYSPLPEYWPDGPPRFQWHRISTLPRWFRAREINRPNLHPALRAALRAVECFETMAGDQRAGRL